MNRLALAVALVGAMILAGCAQTGQQLTLDPQPRSEGAAVGDGVTVTVSGQDGREESRLGVLENRRQGDAELTTDQDLGELVAAAVADLIESRGFQAGDSQRRELAVTVNRLEHRVSSEVPRRVETRVELAFEARNGDRRLSGRNRHARSDQVSGRPSAEENAAYIDATLAGGLERLLTDELLRFLAQP